MQGASVAYDTACSAALVACHSALRALQLGECAHSLVEGVMLMLTSDASISFAVAWGAVTGKHMPTSSRLTPRP